MNKFLYKIVQKIFYFLNKSNAKEVENFCENINFLDIGAAEDLDPRWDMLKNKINFFFVEPHPKSSEELLIQKKNVISKVFSDTPDQLKKFYLTNKPTCSSFLKPNIEYLKKFKDFKRYEIDKILEYETTTVDKEFNNLSLDFIKIDTQGSELSILKGSKKSLKNVLGLEIECEFFQLYEDQPLFEQIRSFLSEYDIIFYDFINIIRWERNSFSHIGQPQFADILFLRSPENVLNLYEEKKINLDKIKNYIIVLARYNKYDLLNFLDIRLKQKNINLGFENIIQTTKRNCKYLNIINHYSMMLKKIINYSTRI